jgi:hypothetical protein
LINQPPVNPSPYGERLAQPLHSTANVARAETDQQLFDLGSSRSSHTAPIDRNGRLVANIEGAQFTATELRDLVQTVLNQ